MRRARLPALLAPWVGIDPRGLAALRIGLAAVLGIDLWMRLGRFRALYTDSGVFPRAFLEPWMRSTIAPFHQLDGGFAWQALLFAAAAGAAACLLLGWRTRLATAVSWLLLVSLHSRQPLVLNFGDDILRMALFWSLFLPLGRRWSLDARRAAPAADPDAPVCSLASAAYLVQIASIYFFTSLLKSGADWHRDGTALYYALSMDAWVTGFGVALREHPALLRAATRATLALEMVGPFLLFAPLAWLRAAAVLAFWTLHLGIAAAYTLGIFPWTDLVVLLPFLPPALWDRLTGVPRAGRAARAPAAGGLGRAGRLVVAAALAYVLLVNLDSVRPLRLPGWLGAAGNFLRIDQQWRMFTPSGPRGDGWFVMPGELADGSRVDLGPHGPALSWDKPARISERNRPFRWAIYLWQISDPYTNHILRRRFAEWTCRTWNAAHPPERRLRALEIHFLYEETLPPGQGVRLEPRLLLRYDCVEGVQSWGMGQQPRPDRPSVERLPPGS
jgi:hypothetical protein